MAEVNRKLSARFLPLVSSTMREKVVLALFVRESIVVPYYSQSFVLFLRLFGVFLLYFHFGPRGKNGQRNQTDLAISTLQQRPKVNIEVVSKGRKAPGTETALPASAPRWILYISNYSLKPFSFFSAPTQCEAHWQLSHCTTADFRRLFPGSARRAAHNQGQCDS